MSINGGIDLMRDKFFVETHNVTQIEAYLLLSERLIEYRGLNNNATKHAMRPAFESYIYLGIAR